MRSLGWIGVGVLAVFSVFVVPTTGCGSKGNNFGDGGGDDSGDPCIEFGQCDDAELNTDSGSTQGDSLTVTPQGVQLTAMGSPVTQQYTALFTSTMMQDPNASWSLDNVALGTIDSTGLFKAFGNVGGVATIDADDQQANAKGSTTVTVSVVLTENPGNISMSDQAKLKQGGNGDAQFRWLYPYNKTVFPRGLTPAVLQFDGQAA